MIVRPISYEEAKPFFLEIHYARRMPLMQFGFGLEVDGELVGAVSFGKPSSPQVARSVVGEEFQAEVIELNRLVVVSPAPNAASFLVAGALKQLPRPKLVVSYADGGQGHVGYIYQATNFLYGGTATSHDSEYIVEGVKTHPRTLAARGISDPARWAKENGIERVKPSPKNRYVFFVGSKSERRKMEAATKWPLSRQYPKGDSSRYDAPNADVAQRVERRRATPKKVVRVHPTASVEPQSRGFAQDISPGYGDPVPFTRQVVAVVCASSFPEPALIAETLRKGQAHDPHTIWVVRDKDKLAVAALEELGVEYLSVGLNPHWKVELPLHGPLKERQRTRPTEVLCDVRRAYREAELIGCSSMVVVFAKPDPGSMATFFEAAPLQSKIKLIVRGKTKARTRKGRKPVGA